MYDGVALALIPALAAVMRLQEAREAPEYGRLLRPVWVGWKWRRLLRRWDHLRVRQMLVVRRPPAGKRHGFVTNTSQNYRFVAQHTK